MYKRLLLLPLGILFLLTFHSCKKDRNKDPIENRSGAITLGEAKSFFETQVLPNNKLSMAIKKSNQTISVKDLITDEKINDLLFKTPMWDKAYSKGVDNGTAIAIPIHFDIKSFIRTDKVNGVKFDNLNYLLIIKSPEGNFTAEWVTLYPDMEWIKGNRQRYIGRIVTADWDGNIKKSIGFEKSGKVSITKLTNTFQSVISNWSTNPSMAKTESYPAIDGYCYENIREVSNGLGVTLYRRRVDCPKLITPRELVPPTFDPNAPTAPNPAQGGGGGGSNYIPVPCTSDPNYKPEPGKPMLSMCPTPIKEEPIIISPCDDAKLLSKSDAFKAMVSTLEGLTSDKKERGFTYKINPDGSFTKTELTGKDGEAGIDFNVNSPIDGYSHTHYTGLLSIFSVSDIYAITQIFKTHNMPINFTATVVTASGTKYMLKVDDIYKFYDFSNNIAGTAQKTYETLYEKLYKITPNNSVEANEKAFLQYLEMTKSGLKLFKNNPDTGTWEPKKVNDQGNIVNNPC